MSPRRVVIVAHRLAPEQGTGIQRYTDEIVKALAAVAGPDITIELVAAAEPTEPSWVPASVPVRRLRGPRRLVNGTWTLLPFPPVEAHVGRADLVHVLSTAIPVPSRAPQVVTVHDLIPIHHREWMEPGPAWVCRRALHRTARHARRVIVPSTAVRDDLCGTLGVLPERVRVVPEGVSDRFTAVGHPRPEADVRARHDVPAGPYVVCVGAVSRRKNLAVVLHALARLRDLGVAPPTLLVAGADDTGAADTHALVETLGLAGAVRFLGFVPDDDLAVLLAGALALVHPSRDEGFGLTPLEAMASGVPALVSDAGAIPEVVGTAGVVIGVDDVEGWAVAIKRLGDDDGHREDLVRRGRERAAAFSWAAAARATLDVYRECFSGAASRGAA
ncbi:MAG TPA: glycosyltransferase family 1 protein [Mycobacteriales bacterium]|nr:glycosyltransferase family 1 protein [Mycobacteriales bacterium]